MKKITLIAGASSGVGEACARLISSELDSLVLIARNEDKLKKIAKELLGEIDIISGDLKDEKFVQSAVKKIISKYGKIDQLIMCAGEGLIKEIQETSEKEWNHMMDTNAKTAFLLLKNVLPEMYSKKEGRIVVIGSEAGLTGFATYGAYCAAKFALTGLCESVYQEARLNGVKISMISPGDIDTPFMEKCPIDMNLMEKYGIKVCEKDKMLKAKDIAVMVKQLLEMPKNNNVFNIKVLPEDFQ